MGVSSGSAPSHVVLVGELKRVVKRFVVAGVEVAKTEAKLWVRVTILSNRLGQDLEPFPPHPSITFNFPQFDNALISHSSSQADPSRSSTDHFVRRWRIIYRVQSSIRSIPGHKPMATSSLGRADSAWTGEMRAVAPATLALLSERNVPRPLRNSQIRPRRRPAPRNGWRDR